MDVLFGDEAPPEATPVEAARAGLAARAGVLQSRQDRRMRRARVIAQSTELRERELMKLASWAAALGVSLRGRGLGPSAAAFAAETSMATQRVAVRRWIEEVPEKVFFVVLFLG